jgi:protein-disulfide isomerase
MRKFVTVASLAFLAIFQAHTGHAQKRSRADTEELKALRQEIESLKEDVKSMRTDLQDIKQMLQARAGGPGAPAQPARISAGTLPALGSQGARVVLVDFSDYQCPFCGRFYRDTMPQLDREYFKTGKVKYIFRDLPLEAIHPHAFKAAQAARCAGEQGKFWEMHYRLFENQRALGPDALTAYAESLEIDTAKFKQCMDADKYAAEIRQDMTDAVNAGINSTPNFVVGLIDGKDARAPNIKVLHVITGARPYSVFKAALDSALATPTQ